MLLEATANGLGYASAPPDAFAEQEREILSPAAAASTKIRKLEAKPEVGEEAAGRGGATIAKEFREASSGDWEMCK